MTLIDRSDSLLIVVDTQPGFVSHNARNELESQAAEAALERLVWLAGIASLLEIPAIVVEAEPDRYGSTEPHLLGRLPPDTPVFARTTFGLAASPEIVTAIRAAGRNTAVLVGFETDVCVAQSAIGLGDLGLRAVVVEDATYSARERQHQRGLQRIAGAGVELNHCKGLAFEWLYTVDQAIETLRVAEKFGLPPSSL
jgi:nicotinamidase-related amidase